MAKRRLHLPEPNEQTSRLDQFQIVAQALGALTLAVVLLGVAILLAEPSADAREFSFSAMACTDDGFEDNDDWDEATPLTSGITISAKICDADRDWFSIPVEEGDTVEVVAVLNHAAGDIDVGIWEPEVDLIEDLNTSNDVETDTFVAAETGDYLFEVYSHPLAGVRNTYDLTVTVTPGPRPCKIAGTTVATALDRDQCDALMALFNDTSGNSWNEKAGWGTPTDPCGWYGVSCAGSHVVELELDDNNLSGALPAEIGHLVGLIELHLQKNSLVGSIPPEIGLLENLERLLLHKNELAGSLPAELGDLVSIEYLYLQFNDFTGTIPPELGNLDNLAYLYLYRTKVSGSIPVELANATNLRRLHLQSNELDGTIPFQIGTLPRLKRLQLQRNQLEGTIPFQIGHLSTLTHLYLFENQLGGPLPASLGNLENLTRLYLHDNAFTGSIPAHFSNLASLKHLNLQNNQLAGSIPREFGALANIERLYLDENDLGGSIPSELGDLTAMQRLYLDDNSFTSLESGLGSLSNLERLYLQRNQLTALPNDLDNLTALDRLYLQTNLLTGDVTNALEDLTDTLTRFRVADPSGNNNCLTADPGLANWLDTIDAGWDDCQP